MTNREVIDKDNDVNTAFIILLEIEEDGTTYTKMFNCTINQCRNIVKRRKYKVVKEGIMTYNDMINGLWKYIEEN
jgi:hypothetical protein